MKITGLFLTVIFIPFLLLTNVVCSDESFGEPNDDDPWLTGPLLAPSARVVTIGHVNLEPYLFYIVADGMYDNDWNAQSLPTFNQIRPQLQYKIGLSEKVDLTGAIQSVVSWSQGKSGSTFGDLPIGFDFQIYKGSETSPLTYAKFTVQEVFPTGKYQNLNPRKLGTDAGGQGAYFTAFGLTCSKLTRFSAGRYLEWRANITALFAPRVHVRGLNAYGGAPGTKGKVSLGPSYNFVTSIQYTMSKKWTFACDFQASYSGRERFKGRTDVFVGSSWSSQLSLAPAIEYNWSESMGIIVGSWFSLAGRNSPRFYSGVAAYNYYF